MGEEKEVDNHEDHEEVISVLKTMEPMYLAALVLGFNELAKNAKTLGDKIYFREHREIVHEALALSGSKDWEITWSAETEKNVGSKEE